MAVLASVVGFIYIQNFVSRQQHLELFSIFGLLFCSYLFWLKQKLSFKTILIYGAILRAALLFGQPSLSDDYKRYFFDSQLLTSGINPYEKKPTALGHDEIEQAGLKHFAINELNSQNYFSVYPPATQLFFAIPSFIGSNSISGFLLISRLLIISLEIGTVLLLRSLLLQIGMPVFFTAIYFLNPLTILEFTGNVHSEFLLIFFLAVSINTLQKPILSASFLCFAFLAKLYPLLFVPLFFKNKWHSKFNLLFSVSFLIISSTAFLTLVGISNFQHILESLSLYYQRFEFNGFIYPLLRELGFFLKGYNTISLNGKILSVAFTVGWISVLWWFWSRSKKNLAAMLLAMVIILTLFQFLATTVMPWYILPVVFIGSILGLQSPIVWSGLSFLSYSAYKTYGVEENMALSFLVYAMVLFFLIRDLGKSHIKFLTFKNSNA